jgi:hypothetical protein
MHDNLGAELTALSAPYGYRRPWSGYGRPLYGYPGAVFVGGAAPTQRTGLTAEVAPILAPATGGMIVRSFMSRSVSTASATARRWISRPRSVE